MITEGSTRVPQTSLQLSIQEIEENAPIIFTWRAQISLTEAYNYEISYDTNVLTTTVTPESVRVVLDEGDPDVVGEPFGSVQANVEYRFVMRPKQIVRRNELPGGPATVDNGQRAIVLSVFPAARRNDPNKVESQTFAWNFRYDTRLPPAPTLTKVTAGEKRLEVTWDAPSSIADVSSYEVLWNPSAGTSSTATVSLDPSSFPRAEGGISVTQNTFSIDGLTNGVAAAVAVRSVDDVGNKGVPSAALTGVPREVSDFFELCKESGCEEEGGFCFIATAAYGSYSAPAVRVLRWFRDSVLEPSPLGAALVWTYYRWSPPLAAQIARDPELRAQARHVLWPVALGALGLMLLPLAAGALVLGRRSRRRAKVLPLAALIVALPLSSARSEERPKPKTTPGFGIEFKGGPYLPAMADDPNDVFTRVFGEASSAERAVRTSPNPLYRIGVDLQLYRGIGTAGIGGSFGFMQFVGRGYFGDSGGRSMDTTVFNLAPLELTAFYRFDWLADRTPVPLVPYLRGGLAYSLWWVTTGTGEISRWEGAGPGEDDDVVGQGGKFGLTGTLGLAFLLNVIEPRSARRLYESTGIRGTYLFAEFSASKIDGFGAPGFDLSDTTWSLGIYFER